MSTYKTDAAARREKKDEDDKQKFIRWNGYTMAQFAVAIALLSGLSVSAIGAGIALLQNPLVSHAGVHSLAFAISLLFFVATILLTLLSTISRLLDFRMTARKVRGRNDAMMFGFDDKQFGKISWALFWLSLTVFLFGTFLFVASVCTAFTLQLCACK